MTCTSGITFAVSGVAGALAGGTTEPLHMCLDGTCHDVTVTRANAGGTIFVAFAGLGTDSEHDLTVTGTRSFKGQYKGKLATFAQKPNGASCPGSCALATVKIGADGTLATVKIGADGTLTPGVPSTPATTTTPTTTPTTIGAGGSATTGTAPPTTNA